MRKGKRDAMRNYTYNRKITLTATFNVINNSCQILSQRKLKSLSQLIKMEMINESEFRWEDDVGRRLGVRELSGEKIRKSFISIKVFRGCLLKSIWWKIFSAYADHCLDLVNTA